MVAIVYFSSLFSETQLKNIFF